MGMRIKRALALAQGFQMVVRDAVNPHNSHAQALEIVKRQVYQHPLWKKLPEWAKERVNTTFSERVHSAHMFGAIRWALYTVPETGEILHHWDDLPEDVRQRFMKNELAGFHYWVKTGKHF